MAMGRRIVPLIMCGGAGTRLWPASREIRPKQFLPLFGARSTFQDTIMRVSDSTLFETPIIITNAAYRFMVLEQLTEIGQKAMFCSSRPRPRLRPRDCGRCGVCANPRHRCGGTGAGGRSCGPRYRCIHFSLPARTGGGRGGAHRYLRRRARASSHGVWLYQPWRDRLGQSPLGGQIRGET